MLKVMESQEPYNTKEDLLEIAQEYKDVKQRQQKNNWALARLAQEAAQKFDLKEFAKLTGENYDVLKNLSSLAGKYSVEDEKQFASFLLFAHFVVAAKSDKRLEWLQKAQNNGWSAARLRREMNPPKSKSVEVIPAESKIIYPRIEPDTGPQKRTLEEIVGALNWYLVNDRATLDAAATSAFDLILLLLNEQRQIVFNGNTGEYEITAPD